MAPLVTTNLYRSLPFNRHSGHLFQIMAPLGGNNLGDMARPLVKRLPSLGQEFASPIDRRNS
jgi:hypothetical protein